MPVARGSRVLGWLSLFLLVLAVFAFVVPLAVAMQESDPTSVVLERTPVEVEAPGNALWGIYFDDADNSGYGHSCRATDDYGQLIDLRDPGVTFTSSDTEMLDLIFTTPPNGRFTIQCDAQSAVARVAPVESIRRVLSALVPAAFLGIAGVIAGVVWLRRDSSIAG
ncbi:hypothetical protein [Aeromicrobium duanguangcaii]|uniref:hypothetical protein n=1 Tax=Aeromicrobium duanguangcaii TaxID=2968086 RepID=UPI002017927B|nr:hypothetical protein [Aeromicrobium duanguangcaii]MCL3836988.1 hypothetical protein [Aeromicrobium duanguangcaii]